MQPRGHGYLAIWVAFRVKFDDDIHFCAAPSKSMFLLTFVFFFYWFLEFLLRRCQAKRVASAVTLLLPLQRRLPPEADTAVGVAAGFC